MYPIHDVDVLLLMAVALASKRLPADLVGIVAAADLLHGSIPHISALAEAFERLSRQDLIAEKEGGYTLTATGQAAMAGQRRKAETEERTLVIREKLAAYTAGEERPPILLTAAQLSGAIVALRTSVKGTGPNLLMPKSKTAERDYKRPQWRKFSAPRRRKD